MVLSVCSSVAPIGPFTVLRDGQIVLQSGIGIANPGRPLGSHVYILQGFDSGRKVIRLDRRRHGKRVMMTMFVSNGSWPPPIV